jgi:RsiW-degrading membrane proteinase PrsW (M82 family)
MDAHSPYIKLAITISINAVVMFLLTYAMIDTLDHFYPNINRVYMALLMVAPMVVLMLIVMHGMYPNKTLNYILIAAFAGLFILVFTLMRTQTPVGNSQFLRSMIPHHSSAIVMCEESTITDPEIVKLCGEIVKAQKEDIAQMLKILSRY